MEQVSGLAQQYYRLLLFVGPPQTGKTPLLKELARKADMPYLNLNRHLSQQLLEYPSKMRPLRVQRVLTDFIQTETADKLILDNIELLFEPTLQQEPLTLLKHLSRLKSLVVAWPGVYQPNTQGLSYARPGHPEYKRYPRYPGAGAIFKGLAGI